MDRDDIIAMGLNEAIRRKKISLTIQNKKFSSFRGDTSGRIKERRKIMHKVVMIESELVELETLRRSHNKLKS